MRRNLPILALLAWSTPCLADPSLSDLAAESQRSNRMVEACESGLVDCTTESQRLALARSFYTQALASYVYGRPPDLQAAANVAFLSAPLAQRLPVGLHDGSIEVSSWVRSLVQPPVLRPVSSIRPVVIPTPLAVVTLDIAETPHPWIARYRSSAAGNTVDTLALSRLLEHNGMDAASLMVLRDTWYQSRLPEEGAVKLVFLARTVAGRQPLVALAQHRSPDTWPKSVRSDLHLAQGLAYQARGEVSPALKAFGAIKSDSAAYVHGEYQLGVLYRQSGEPWMALRSFQLAWDAEGEGANDARVRDQAVWQLAELNQELGRPDEAIALYEVLTIGDTPLVHRAALKSAWVAHDQGDNTLALKWIPALPAAGVVSADVHLLRASLAARRSETASALRYLDTAEHGIHTIHQELAALLKHGVVVEKTTAKPKTNPLFAARLAADPGWRALRDHVGAIRRDRALLLGEGVDLPIEVRQALAKRLAVRSRIISVQSEQRARFVLSRLRDELVVLQRQIAQLNARVQP